MTSPGTENEATPSREPRGFFEGSPIMEQPEDVVGVDNYVSIGEFALFLLRVALGLSMLQVSYKLFRGGWDAWLNASGLLPGVVKGPLGSIYASVWGSPVVLWLVILGALAVGIGLTFGFLTRLSALVGTFMMLGFYTADLPPTSGWFEVQFVQIFAYFLVASLGAGHVWGIDSLLRDRESESRWWYFALG